MAAPDPRVGAPSARTDPGPSCPTSPGSPILPMGLHGATPVLAPGRDGDVVTSKRSGKTREGQGIAEFGLIVVLVSVLCIVLVQALGVNTEAFYVRAANEVAGALSSVSS